MTMRTIATIPALRLVLDQARADGARIGFVPTMGFFHEGHLSLMRAARADTDLVVVSLFVNPLQFAANEDLADYPRNRERDQSMASSVGADILFAPAVAEMYPDGDVLTTVAVPDMATRWEGSLRPTHFAGVATVVAKLFSIVGPCRAYFGEKDYQQLTIIRQMAADLSMPVEVIGCPIVREDDGLAMSSRNVFLDPDERRAAVALRRALEAGRVHLLEGSRDLDDAVAAMKETTRIEPLVDLDYAAVVDARNLSIPEAVEGDLRLLIAARIGRPRLIDNLGVTLRPAATEPSMTEESPNQ